MHILLETVVSAGKTAICMPVCFDVERDSISDGETEFETFQGDTDILNRKDQATDY